MARDYSSWNKAVRELQQLATKKTALEIVESAVGGFIREVINVTPPADGKADSAAKKAGEIAVAGDLAKLAHAVTVSGKGRAHLASASELMAAHAAASYRRLRNRDFREPLLVSHQTFNQVARALQARVGWLSAGWNQAAARFNVRVPSWVKRHGSKYGNIKVEFSAGRLRIVFVNDVPFIDKVDGLHKQVDFALQKQTRKMQSAARETIKKLARKAGLKT